MQPHYPRQRVVLDTVSFTSNFGSLCFALVFFFFFFFFLASGKAASTHCQIKYLICQQHPCELIIIQ